MDPQPSSPAPASQRFELIDALRGFALFGVLLANFLWVGFWFPGTNDRDDAPSLPTDDAIDFTVMLLVDYKFYTLFSFLFGLGFAMQLERARRRGVSPVPAYSRRTGVLLVLGLVHCLIWFGDILHVYAVLGFGLLLLRNLSTRAVLVLAGALFALDALMPTADWLLGLTPEGSVPQPDTARRYEVLTSGSVVDVVRLNIHELATDYANLSWSGSMMSWYVSVAARFLVGVAVGRWAVLQHSEEHRAMFRRGALVFLPLGLLGCLAFVGVAWIEDVIIYRANSAWRLLTIPASLGVPLLAAGYVCVLAWGYGSGRFGALYTPLAAVGRLALTNYLTHTAIYLGFFYGLGLGQIGRHSVTVAVGLVCVIYAAQACFSMLWLRPFRFGPAEWVWRCLTYGPTPIRRVPESE